MIHVVEGYQRPGMNPLLDAMHRDRKRIFVDLMKWDVPVIDETYEVDQFDGTRAIYCIATDARGGHRGSIRLLPSDHPHILGDIFPDLCEAPVPRGPTTWELSRGCLSPGIPKSDRLQVRNELTSAVVAYALHRGISTYTCIADSAWFGQILSLGWQCHPLGFPRRIGHAMTGALSIEITDRTPALLDKAGTFVPTRLVVGDDQTLVHA